MNAKTLTGAAFAAGLAAALTGCAATLPFTNSAPDPGEIVLVRCPAYEAPRPRWDCPVREDFATPDDYNALALCIQKLRDMYGLKRDLWDLDAASCPDLP